MSVSYNAIYGSDLLEVPSIPTVSSSMSSKIGGTSAQPALISFPHLCPKPLGAMFDTIKCVISSTDVNTFQFAGTTSTL